MHVCLGRGSSYGGTKRENKDAHPDRGMLVMTTFPALADEVDDAHRLAVSGRDAYWNCLAREYPRDTNKTMSEQEFAALIAPPALRSGRISG